MNGTTTGGNLRSYWIIWFVLLALSVVMIIVDQSGLTRGMLLTVLLGGMLAKATLIVSQYMHLRYEKRSFVLIIVLTTILTAAFMFGLMAIDGMRVLDLSY